VQQSDQLRIADSAARHSWSEFPEDGIASHQPANRPNMRTIDPSLLFNCLFLLILVFASHSASAKTIDFENVGRDSCLYYIGSFFSTDGFDFRNPLSGNGFFTCNPAVDPTFRPSNGTRAVITRSMLITESTGAPFSAISIDLAEPVLYSRYGAVTILMLGISESGFGVNASFTVDNQGDGPGGIDDFETFVFPPTFSNLVSVRFTVIGNFGYDLFFFDNLVVEPATPPLDVTIDIKPSGDPNSINLSDEGVVPVAILGSDTFNVADVDAISLAFGPGSAPFDHSHGPHFEEVNGDGFLDLVAHFEVKETGISFGDTEACLTGQLLDGTPFKSCDAVRTVPDMDGDKLLDTDEVALGTNAMNPDTDGDGFGDGEEVLILSTDPLDAGDPAPTQTRTQPSRRRR
jgi:Bacterial TSP3 repeat